MLASFLGFAFALPVAADIASDKPAAVVVFPKLLVDSANGLDTLIRLSNTSDTSLKIRCLYVNTTPHCRTSTPDPNSCFREGVCSTVCDPQWVETDFEITLTARQPTGWLVSEGTNLCSSPLSGALLGVCSNDSNTECARNSDCGPPSSGARCVIPPCLPLLGPPFQRPDGQKNEGSVPPSPEDPFIGELKCIALDETGAPTDRNDLKGEVLIGKHDEADDFIDVSGYNGIGIPAIPDTGNRDNTLVLGGPPLSCGTSTDCPTGVECVDGVCDDPNDLCHTSGLCAEYQGCPNILILNHFFDGAVDPTVHNVCRSEICTISKTECKDDSECVNRCEGQACTITSTSCTGDADCPDLATQVRIGTSLTLVPCTEDFRSQQPELAFTPAQMIIFNELEQRFSTSIGVQCFEEIQLSNIETSQNERSIFSVGVAGTLTGQTRISGVVTKGSDHGNGLMGVAEEFRCQGPDFPLCNFIRSERLISSAGFNLHFQGTRALSDFIFLP